MSRDRATEIAASGATVDVGDATTRFLLCGLLPGWFLPGPADWVMHRSTRIEETSGTRESLIHALMTAEVGLPTALWDVRTAVDSDREVKPLEQHIHSFLESPSFGGRGDPDAWRLAPGAPAAAAVGPLPGGDRPRDRRVRAAAVRRGAAALPARGRNVAPARIRIPDTRNPKSSRNSRNLPKESEEPCASRFWWPPRASSRWS
ncbi:hypothetical protein [Streptomyces bungoensis]|uniref:hypothetical protein n=1 Tax=Streptomyces bungoensis TaxID=285568 RepID=UPI0007C75447